MPKACKVKRMVGSVNLSEFNLTPEEIRCISPESISHNPAAIVLLKISKFVYDRDINRVVSGEVGSSDDKPRQDFKYLLGSAMLAKTLLDAPKEADRWLK